jgi:hypothetical protein
MRQRVILFDDYAAGRGKDAECGARGRKDTDR